MNSIIRRANSRISLGGAATLLITSAFVAQMLGFLRTKLVNANFYATGPQSTDAYFAAFKIPDFFFLTIAAGALGVAFMPVLADHVARGDRKGAWQLSSSLLNLMFMFMAFVSLVIFVFAEPLIHHIVAPNLTPDQLHNAVTIMRFLSLNPLIFSISGILTSMQQTYGRFFFYALAPIVYNLTIIVSIYLFKDNLGIIGLGVGALIGAILQLIVVIFGLTGFGYKYRPKIVWASPDFRSVLRQLPPRSIDQGIDSINSIVETNLARRLGEGYLSYYENAFTLHMAPTLLIGTAISTAAFPRLNERLSQGRPDLYRKDFLQILRVMIWIVMPVTVICYFARGYLARLIFSRDAPEIAMIFGFFAVAIFFRTIYTMISRYFYSHKDTRTPLFVSLFAIGLNIILAYKLSRPSAYGVSGLAMAQSIVAASEVALLFTIMVLRDPKLITRSFWGGVFRILSVTGFSVMASYIIVSLIPLNVSDRGFVTLGVKLGSIAFVTLATYLTFSSLFGLEEMRPIVDRLRRIILKPVKV